MASVIEEKTIHARIMFVKTFKLTVIGITKLAYRDYSCYPISDTPLYNGQPAKVSIIGKL